MNIVCLTGRLTADIEVRYTQNQTAFCSFALAVDRGKDSQGNKITDFIRCQAWSKTAEIMKQYCHKGMMIGVSGQIQTGSYTDKNGQKRNTTEVVVSRMEFLESRQQTEQFVPVQGGDEDLPF